MRRIQRRTDKYYSPALIQPGRDRLGQRWLEFPDLYSSRWNILCSSHFRFHIEIDNGDVRGVTFDRNTGYGNAFYRMGDGSAANVPFRIESTGIGYRCTPGTGYQYIPGQGFYPYNWMWPGTSLVPTLGGSWIPGTGVAVLPGSNILALPESGIPALTEGSALALPGVVSPAL